jgi:hypothetical protein
VGDGDGKGVQRENHRKREKCRLLRAFIVLSLPKVVPLQRPMMIIENGKEERG